MGIASILFQEQREGEGILPHIPKEEEDVEAAEFDDVDEEEEEEDEPSFACCAEI